MNRRIVLFSTALGLLLLALLSYRSPLALAAPRAAIATATPPGPILFQDNFNSYTSGQIITDSTTYSFANFPNGGASGPLNPSALWETDTGKFVADNGWGFTGKPNEWIDRWYFRPNTRDFSFGDVEVRWKYRSAPFGQDGFPVEGADAVDLWLRYQTQYNLYTLQFDKTNNCLVAKRKVPAEGWGGDTSLISNRGVYYTLFTDSDQPVVGGGAQCISWAMISGEPALAHDSTTVYDMRARVVNKPGGTVQIQFWRNEIMWASWTDNNDGTAADGATFSAHLSQGLYNTVPGWNPDWGHPITAPGASGFRADNIKAWIDDFVVYSLSSGGTPLPTFTRTPTRPVVSPTLTRTSTPTTPPAATHTPTRTPTAGPTATRTPTSTLGASRTPTSGPSATRTPTSIVGASNTPTPTLGASPTRTPTPIVGASSTPPAPTATPTSGGGSACAPVTSTIAVPFTYDGAGMFCWQAASLGAYVNSWNLTSLTVNGVNFTNLYVAAGSYPARINGYWYVSYNSAVAYGHFEAK